MPFRVAIVPCRVEHYGAEIVCRFVVMRQFCAIVINPGVGVHKVGKKVIGHKRTWVLASPGVPGTTFSTSVSSRGGIKAGAPTSGASPLPRCARRRRSHVHGGRTGPSADRAWNSQCAGRHALGGGVGRVGGRSCYRNGGRSEVREGQ